MVNSSKILGLLACLLLLSCGERRGNKDQKEEGSSDSYAQHETLAADKALQFINAYVENCNKRKEAMDVVDWVRKSDMTTEAFSKALTSLLDEALKEEPEIGLDADPIFNAQDYPDKGFELESYDKTSHLIVVKGKERPDFTLTIKMREENNNWLVDGCGMVNGQ